MTRRPDSFTAASCASPLLSVRPVANAQRVASAVVPSVVASPVGAAGAAQVSTSSTTIGVRCGARTRTE